MTPRFTPMRACMFACAVTLAACSTEGFPHGDTAVPIPATASATSSSAAPRAAPSDTANARDTITGLAPDSATAAAPYTGPRDTTAVVASDAELAELRAAMIVPVQGVKAADLTDNYTEARGGHSHEALDIHAPRGTPVLSAAAGRLLKLHESADGGHMVYAADASDRFILMYAHLDRYADGLTDGMPLKQGQLLGYVGTTGNAAPDAPHLHFAIARGRPSQVWWKGTAVNPFPLLAASR